MSSYEQLTSEHLAIERLAARLAAALDDPSPDLSALAVTLGALGAELRDHLAAEDRVVYPSLAAAADPGVAATARRFMDEMGGLKADWEAFLARWPDRAIQGDRPRFADEARGMLDRIARRVRAETTVLYPLALQTSVIPLRAAPRRAGAAVPTGCVRP